MKLSRESLILLIVGLVDLLTTLVWVSHHGAQEGNPIFSYYLTMGPLWFIAMKMVCLLCPILIFEWARNHRPRVARVGARIAIAGYLLFYVVGVARLNPQLLGTGERPSPVMGTLGAKWGGGHIAIAEHTFRMPISFAESPYPVEGLR